MWRYLRASVNYLRHELSFALWDVTWIRIVSAGYSGVNPSGFVFPGAHDYDNYGYGAHNPYNANGGAGYVPVDFNALFQQYISSMQHLAQQQAYALKWVAGVVEVCCAHSKTSYVRNGHE